MGRVNKLSNEHLPTGTSSNWIPMHECFAQLLGPICILHPLFTAEAGEDVCFATAYVASSTFASRSIPEIG